MVGGHALRGPRALGDWQLARALAARRDVLYIDPPLYSRELLRSRDPRALRPSVHRVSAGLTVFRPVAPPGANRPWGLRLGDAVLGTQLSRAAGCLACPRVLLVFDPKRGVLPEVERDLLVYWRRDRLRLSANTRQPELIDRRDRELIRAADLVTGVSPPLVMESTEQGARSVLIPNGCDYEHFAAPQPCPRGFPEGRPVVGFAGGVSSRLDVGLLVAIADARPEWTVLLVGERTVDVPPRQNLVVAGRRPYAQLPAWVQRFDVGVIPYRPDGFNVAASPLKLYEYLAAGVPVVSAPLPAVRPRAGAITTATSPRAFVDAIEAMLSARADPAACRHLASQHDWSHRATLLESHIEEVLARPGPARTTPAPAESRATPSRPPPPEKPARRRAPPQEPRPTAPEHPPAPSSSARRSLADDSRQTEEPRGY